MSSEPGGPAPEQPNPEQPNPEQPNPEQPSPEQPSPERPAPDWSAPLGWLYALIGAGVFSLGAVSGAIFFHSFRPLAVDFLRARVACGRAFPGQPATGPDGDNAALLGYLSCAADATRVVGYTMLGGVAAMALGFAVLLVAVPLIDRWRLHRRTVRLDVPMAAARFAELCDRHGLGARRPRLLIAGPPVRRAFTTGLPFGRPTVVLPAAVAVAHADPRRFDPVVSHELAHVLSRDVTWVSAVRGLLWLIVPAVTVAVVPDWLAGGRTAIPATMYLRGAVLAAATASLGALLLRLRERAADAYAARSGHEDALVALLSAAAARDRSRRLWRRPLATHPSPADRLRALGAATALPDGGLGQSAVVGGVTAMAAGSAAELAHSLAIDSDLSLIPAAVTGLLLGFALTPALLRRATRARRSGRPAGWWRPAVGTAVGLGAGTFVFPGAGFLGATSFPAATLDGWVGAIAALGLAAVGAGVATLGGAVAGLLAAVYPGATGPGRARRAEAYAAMAATATAACWPLASLAGAVYQPAVLRNWLVYALPDYPWPLLALALPAVSVVLLRPIRAPIPWWTGAAALAAGAGGGIAHDLLNPPVQLDQATWVTQERWWICALAGLVALVVVALGRGPARLATAVVVAWPVAALAGAAQLALDLSQGRPLDWVLVRGHLVTPTVWLVYLTILSAPVLAGLGRLRARPAATDAARTVRPPVPAPAAPGWATVSAPALAALVGSVTAVLVIAGPGIPLAYAPPILPPTATPSHPTGTGPPGPVVTGPGERGLDPGRPLTAAQARAAADTAGTVLPRHWRPETIESAPSTSVTSPAACEPLADAEYLDALTPSRRVEVQARYATEPMAGGVVSSTLTVTVTSYANPVPGAVLAAAEAARAACPRFSARQSPDTDPVRFVVRAYPLPPLGEQTFGMVYDMSLGSGPEKITGTSVVAHVRAGHNLVVVVLTAIMEPVDNELFRSALTATVRALGTP